MTDRIGIWDGERYRPAFPFDANAEDASPFTDCKLHQETHFRGIRILFTQVRVPYKSWFPSTRFEYIVLVRVGTQTAAYPRNPKLRLESQVLLHVKEALDA